MALADTLQEFVANKYGTRTVEEQAETVAMGFVKQRPDYLYAGRQAGPVEDNSKKVQFNNKQVTVFDVRNNVVTKLNKSEWTGYHAEMIVFSGMLAAFEIDATKSSISNLKNTLKDYEIAICANAPCCKHCAIFLTAVGIKYKNKSSNAGNTGWWNPVKDKAAAHGSEEFNKDIPFE